MGNSIDKLTADIIIETAAGGIVLVKRKYPPYEGSWALPGGLMEADETIEQAAAREAKEETGIDVELTGIVGVYSDPGRDTRGRYVTVAYAARQVGGLLAAADDAAAVMEATEPEKMALAFDHNKIVADYLKMKGKMAQ
jgi:8-oxo-dGTP diphosphatase